MIELPVPAGDDPVAYAVVDFRIPGTSYVGDQSVQVPVGQGEQRRVLDTVFHVAAVHDLVGQHPGDAGPDLPVKFLVVAGEVQENLVAHDPGDAADVVVGGLFRFEADVALLRLTQLVVNDELDAAVEFVVEEFLDLLQVLIRRTAGKRGEFQSAEVVVRIEILELHERPEPVIVLHAVLSELHFIAIIELAGGAHGKQQEQEDPYGKPKQKRLDRTHRKTGG